MKVNEFINVNIKYIKKSVTFLYTNSNPYKNKRTDVQFLFAIATKTYITSGNNLNKIYSDSIKKKI